MAPEQDGLVEPEITINGVHLSFGQAMTVRVALETFAIHVSGVFKENPSDGTYQNYMDRIREIREYYMANQPKQKVARHSDWTGDDFKMPGA